MASYPSSRERSEALKNIVEAVARHLPDGPWTLAPWRGGPLDPPWFFTLTASGERALGARFDTKGERVEWSGELPRAGNGNRPWGLEYKESIPAITTAANKDAVVIARDIARRILPTYLPMLAKGLAARKADEDYRGRTTAFGAMLAERLGCKLNEGREDVSMSFYHEGSGYGDLRVYDDSVRFDRLSLSGDLALKLADLIREDTAKRREALSARKAAEAAGLEVP